MADKIGILGGTFNPVHIGHIQLGLAIKEAFNLDKILYILAANPPHKRRDELAPAEIRWKMLTEALGRYPQLEPCDIEMKRSEDSWTVDTIRELKNDNPGTHYYFISGSEGFLKIRTWKDYKELLTMISFIVVLRDETHRPYVQQLLREEEIPFSDHYPFISNEHLPKVYLYSYKSDTITVSSTLIRNKIKQSESIESLVEAKVKKIMEEFKLYEN